MTLIDGLISFYECEEASGDLIDAVTTSGNDLTDMNTVTSAAGKVGFARHFAQGSSEYGTRADNASLSTGATSFSVCAWGYMDSKPATLSTIAMKGTADDEWYLIHDEPSDRFKFGATIPVKVATATTLGAPSLAAWYFLVGVYDVVAETVSISANAGIADSTSTAGSTPTDTTGQFNIGAYRNGLFTWDGRIDQVGFWKRVLTNADIAQLYNGGDGLSYAAMVAAANAGRQRSRTNSRMAELLLTGGRRRY